MSKPGDATMGSCRRRMGQWARPSMDAVTKAHHMGSSGRASIVLTSLEASSTFWTHKTSPVGGALTILACVPLFNSPMLSRRRYGDPQTKKRNPAPTPLLLTGDVAILRAPARNHSSQPRGGNKPEAGHAFPKSHYRKQPQLCYRVAKSRLTLAASSHP